ncbi:MAG TPA: sugar transferase [Solirubrobacterales bacterium]|nr:sugar transferase [Solirubrobacterales bacterium]
MAIDLDIDAQTGTAAGLLGVGREGLRQRVISRRHSHRDGEARRLLLVADVLAVSLGFAVSTLLLGHPDEFLWGVLSLPLWVVVFKAYGLYDRDTKRISHGTVDDLPWIFHAMLLGTLLLLGLLRLTPLGGFELRDLAIFAVFTMAAVAAFRVLARHLGSSLLGPERVLLVGDGEPVRMLARKLGSHPEYAVEPVALVSLEELDLEGAAKRHQIERLVVSQEDYDNERLFELLCRCRELQIKLSVLPQLFDALGPSVELDDVEGVTVLGITPPVLPRSSRFLKRAMDVLGASLLLVIAAPVIAVCAIAIKLDSRGPVLFRQTRIGREGRRFQLLKCRTMVVGAEQRRAELLAQSKDPGWLLLDHDPRITRVGRFLRRSSLDELPQLWNVLRGEMSLVGPRPIVEDEDRQLEGWRRTRIDLTPGITGLWQVLGRTSIPFEEMIKLDYLYVTNWTLWTDVSLVLRTLPAVLLKRGVN